MKLNLTSPSFEHGAEMPRRHSCEGAELSPPLAWSNLPRDTRSLVLIVDDPDAPDPARPQRTWVHWIVYNLPPEAGGLPEGVNGDTLPQGARQGKNDWSRADYGGPCPPVGRHRYMHKLYALDTVLPDLGVATKPEVQRAMHGHVLAQATLIGTYARQSTYNAEIGSGME